MEHSEFIESGGGYKISEALSNFGAPTSIAPTSDQEIKSPGQDVSIAISDAAGGRVHWGERGGNTRGESGRVKKEREEGRRMAFSFYGGTRVRSEVGKSIKM